MRMINFFHIDKDDVLAVEAYGKITKEDYRQFNVITDEKLRKNSREAINLLVKTSNIEGFSLPAMWREIKTDIKYYDDFNKVAIVGDAAWEKVFTKIYKPLNKGEVKFFPLSEYLEAVRWIKSDNT